MSKQFNQDKLEDWLLKNVHIEADRYNADMEKKKKAAPRKTVDTAKIMAKIEKLKDLYLSDLLPKMMYEREYLALSAALEEATKQQEVAELKPIDTSIFDDLSETYEKLTDSSKKAFWSRILRQITVSPTGDVSIQFNSF